MCFTFTSQFKVLVKKERIKKENFIEVEKVTKWASVR